MRGQRVSTGDLLHTRTHVNVVTSAYQIGGAHVRREIRVAVRIAAEDGILWCVSRRGSEERERAERFAPRGAGGASAAAFGRAV